MSLRVMTQGGGGGESASIFVKGLSEADTVTATKGGKTVQGKWVQNLNPSSVGLPDGYTQLEYIESTGTQYIDTGVSVPHANHKVYIKFSTSNPEQNAPITGHNYGVWGWGTGMMYVAANQTFDINMTAIGVSVIANTVYEVTYSNTAIEINGTQYSANFTGYTDGYNDTVFYGNGRFGKAILEEYILWNGNEIVRHLIPARRNSDNAIGAYDLVNDVFYTNAGTGTFIAGAEVPSTIDGHSIEKIKEYGIWTVTATNGEKSTTYDVLVDAAMEFLLSIPTVDETYLVRTANTLIATIGNRTWRKSFDGVAAACIWCWDGSYYVPTLVSKTSDGATIKNTYSNKHWYPDATVTHAGNQYYISTLEEGMAATQTITGGYPFIGNFSDGDIETERVRSAIELIELSGLWRA